ncbi:hypothetical protein AB834_03545 [PVC group bacterium (ex Bugula neritina AB1)]|nr:hypothetical protein AB834_03545 [PVC group bacterium (ex Bugula neritina AB1)]
MIRASYPNLFKVSELTHKGFKNCVIYASINFDPNFSNIPSKFTARNFKDNALKDFISIVKTYDINTFDNRPNGNKLKEDFIKFREAILKGIAPTLTLKFVDPRLGIISMLYPDNDFIIYCNMVEKTSKGYQGFNSDDPLFNHLEQRNKSFFFDVVRFIILSTVSDIDFREQVCTISEAYSKTVQDNLSDVRRIHLIINFVTKIRAKFFDDIDSPFGRLNNLLDKSFRERRHQRLMRDFVDPKPTPYFRYIVESKDSNEFNVQTIEEVSSYKQSILFERPSGYFVSNNSRDFSILRLYLQFLNADFHMYIFNLAVADDQFAYYLSKGMQSCRVGANDVNTLTIYFDRSFKNLHKHNRRLVNNLDPLIRISSDFINKPTPRYSNLVMFKGFIILLELIP